MTTDENGNDPTETSESPPTETQEHTPSPGAAGVARMICACFMAKPDPNPLGLY